MASIAEIAARLVGVETHANDVRAHLAQAASALQQASRQVSSLQAMIAPIQGATGFSATVADMLAQCQRMQATLNSMARPLGSLTVNVESIKRSAHDKAASLRQ
jgi:hypothetical protein